MVHASDEIFLIRLNFLAYLSAPVGLVGTCFEDDNLLKVDSTLQRHPAGSQCLAEIDKFSRFIRLACNDKQPYVLRHPSATLTARCD